MNAEGKNESPTFEDVDENISVGPANSPEATTEATSGPTSEPTSEATSEATSEPTTISSIGSTNSNRSNSNNSNNSSNNSSNSNSSNSNSSNSSNSNSSNSSNNSKSNTPVLPNKTETPPAAKTVLDSRRAVFEGDLRQAYINAFGDEKKAPKPKFLEATALVKIRREQGEDAYKAKIKEYVDRNRGIYEAKPAKGTRKKVTVATNMAVNTAVNTTTAGPINRGNSRQKLIQSVRTMADSAKDLIDNLVSATMSLAKTNTGDMTSIATRAVSALDGTAKHRKTRSNKGKTHKKSAVRMNNSA